MRVEHIVGVGVRMNQLAKVVSVLWLSVLYAANADACMARIERGDRMVSAWTDISRKVPAEYSFMTGDLILLDSKKGAEVSVVESPDSKASALQKVDVQTYERLAADIRDTSPRWNSFKNLQMSGSVWSYFVAGNPGVAHIKVQSGKNIDWIRIEVKGRPYVPHVQKASELTQSEVLTFMFHDYIEIELPGALAAGWQVTAEKDVGMKLVSVANVSPERSDQSEGSDAQTLDRVRLRFVSGNAQAAAYGEKRLEIQGGWQTFAFTVRQRPTPKC